MKRKLLVVLSVVMSLILILGIWFYQRVTYSAPQVFSKGFTPNVDFSERITHDENHFSLGSSWLRKAPSGNWESYIQGDACERGTAMSILHQELIRGQEVVFVDEIKNKVPSWGLRQLLLLGIGWFNRDLDQSIKEEYQQELYCLSYGFSDDFNFIGPKYNRLLNYHAAHDIGHAVQNLRFVGCTVVGNKNLDQPTPQLISGRNFDFYFGDEFAKNKIILLSNPDEGYKYLSVTWGGFTGVVSGMNEHGLGITLNADKSEIPTKSGTPVSVLAREILQYAKNIEEATAIAEKYTTFVSESFTISSAYDSAFAVIEKTPLTMDIYRPEGQDLVVTNHFQSPSLKDLEINKEHIATSESMYRYQRSKELIDSVQTIDVGTIAHILRDRNGVDGEAIGYGNPAAINQLIAHHAVIFDNFNRTVWVSSYPYQEAEFEAYDLRNFGQWTHEKVRFPISDQRRRIAADDFLASPGFGSYKTYLRLRAQIIEATQEEQLLSEDLIKEFESANSAYYETYKLIGEYYQAHKKREEARSAFLASLDRHIPYQEEQDYIKGLLEALEN